MKMSLSRSVFAASAAAVLVLAPIRPDAGHAVHAAPGVHTHYRELCQLLAVWDPNRTETSVVPAPGRPIAGDWHGLLSGLVSANITVNYSAGFDPAARAAFQAAVDIWASQISSPVPITIDANWSPLGSGVLGQAGSTFVYTNFGAGTANTYYHAALANKLAGVDVDPAASDITATFNSSFTSWYFGTDRATPLNKYDFMSVVLHEIGHGLGFSGSARSDGSTGSYGLGAGSAPMIYDRFAETTSKQPIVNTAIFPNPSAALHVALTGENADPTTGLFWSGAAGIVAAGGGTNRPRLDALAPFTSGSNFSHLSETTYPAGNPNSLMTRALLNGEVIHNPGPLTLGIFQDEGWSLGCNYTLSPPSALILPAGSTNTVTVTAPAGCAWTATAPAGSFVTITGGASGTGTGTVTYTVPASSTTPRSTTLTIAGIAFLVTQGPILAVDRATLRFGATNAAGTLSNITSGQPVGVSITGATGLAWTATVTSTSPWLRITGGSGTGNGTFTVTVASDPSLSGVTTATGTINVVATGTSNTPKTINVILTTKAVGATTGPTGAFDTPAEGGPALTGSVAVTGWATDDIEVVRVQIQRDAHPNDPPGASFNGKVFVGDASFVEGARGDIEAGVPAPFNYRAGWGYLMLTRGLIWDGGGPFRLYALATDKEGNTVTLGSKTITVSNAGSTKPFGSIDSPGQGATVSGGLGNTGWVLTPNAGATIPDAGVRVAVDGVFLPGVPTVSARADITAGFPQFNTTRAGRGLGFETTAFANGTHTIGWLVTDSTGAADGVGSRFFKIQNASQVATTTAALAGSSTTFADTFEPASRLAGIDTGAAVRVATGMDPRAKLTAVHPDAFGRRHVAIPELDRVEVRLASQVPAKGGSDRNTYAAYQVTNGQLRRLPVGSSFDPRNGTLYWQPGAGYVGDYEFVVVDQSRRDAKRLTHVVVSVGRTAPPAVVSRTRATN